MKSVFTKHTFLKFVIAPLIFMGGAVCVSEAQSAQNEVQITAKDGYRYFTANGIPNHPTGKFPNAHNPHSIKPQPYAFKVTQKPEKVGAVTFLENNMLFGVALNGVPFDPGTAEFWNGNRNWAIEVLSGAKDLGIDKYGGHVQPNGAYHYHGIPAALVKKDLSHVGYAADGFPIFVSKAGKFKPSYKLKSGKRSGGPAGSYDGTYTADYEYKPGSGTLDRCNGVKVNDKYYIYILTKEFPHIPRCWSGNPDTSFAKVAPRHQHHERRSGEAPALLDDKNARMIEARRRRMQKRQ